MGSMTTYIIFDETGFQMGIISTAKVITAVERRRTVSIQPRNREWVTVIECIEARNKVLPPLVILKGKMNQRSWCQGIPSEWAIGVIDNGWTTDELGHTWLKEVSDKHTKDGIVRVYRLLILDGHGATLQLHSTNTVKTTLLLSFVCLHIRLTSYSRRCWLFCCPKASLRASCRGGYAGRYQPYRQNRFLRVIQRCTLLE